MNRRDFLKNCSVVGIGIPFINFGKRDITAKLKPYKDNFKTIFDAFTVRKYNPFGRAEVMPGLNEYSMNEAYIEYKDKLIWLPMLPISEAMYSIGLPNQHTYDCITTFLKRRIELDLYRSVFSSAYCNKYGQLTLKTKTRIKNKLINQIELVYQYKKLDKTLPSPINNPLATQIQSIDLRLDISDPTLFEIYTPRGCWLDDAPYGEYVKGCQNHVRRTIRYGILIKDRSKIELVVNGTPVNHLPTFYTIPFGRIPEKLIIGI